MCNILFEMIPNKALVTIFLLIAWISYANSCNDCCRSTATTNCCSPSPCCSPCASCTTISCTKNCNVDCPTTIRPNPEPEIEKVVPQVSIPQPQVIPSSPSRSETRNDLSNDNKVNVTAGLNLNNTLSNVNSIHLPINITNVNTNNIKVESRDSRIGGAPVQPVTQIIPGAKPFTPQAPKIYFVLVRQPPVYIPQPKPMPIPMPTPVPIPNPVPMPNPMPMPNPTYFNIPTQNNCCIMQPMGCCSIQPQCNFQQCMSPCMRFC